MRRRKSRRRERRRGEREGEEKEEEEEEEEEEEDEDEEEEVWFVCSKQISYRKMRKSAKNGKNDQKWPKTM